MKVYIIHENDEWTLPLKLELQKLEVNFEDWHVENTYIDLGKIPPQGVFYNRMSASSHTRDHRYAPEFTATVLNWLKNHKRRVINNNNALALEISKSLQYLKLNESGIRTPRSIYCNSKKQILKAAKHFSKPFITKHNRGGRGLGVKLFKDKDELNSYVNGPDFENSVDGITILQDYIETNPKVIHRIEFINSKFYYTVQVDASESFELCPADVCNVENKFCSVNPDGNKFMILKSYKNFEIPSYEKFLKSNNIEIAGIEYVTDINGIHFTYDVNTNTNYNSIAEKKVKQFGMKQIALFLKEELKKINCINIH